MRDIALWTSETLDIISFAVILIGVAISTAVLYSSRIALRSSLVMFDP